MEKKEERTPEEKYSLAKMMLMLIERMCLAVMMGHIPPQYLVDTLRQIGNMCHVANHVNEEITFDCGPDAEAHHQGAMEEYLLMWQAMLEDIAAGTDYSQMVAGAMDAKNSFAKSLDIEEDDDEFIPPTLH